MCKPHTPQTCHALCPSETQNTTLAWRSLFANIEEQWFLNCRQTFDFTQPNSKNILHEPHPSAQQLQPLDSFLSGFITDKMWPLFYWRSRTCQIFTNSFRRLKMSLLQCNKLPQKGPDKERASLYCPELVYCGLSIAKSDWWRKHICTHRNISKRGIKFRSENKTKPHY